MKKNKKTWATVSLHIVHTVIEVFVVKEKENESKYK